MNTTDRPDDLISIKDACKLVPSPHGGHGVHLNTFRRWVLAGRLRHWRNGPWIVVSKADVMMLFEPVAKPTPEAVPVASTTLETLKRHGLDRYLTGNG